jgi:hypothetical protein
MEKVEETGDVVKKSDREDEMGPDGLMFVHALDVEGQVRG